MTRFVPGVSGNPAGRPRGLVDRRSEVRLMLESHSEALISQAVKRALEGSDVVLVALINRLVPSLRAEISTAGLDPPKAITVRWASETD